MDESNFALEREYILEGLNNTAVKAYYKFMVEMAMILGADKKIAEEELLKSLLFELELIQVCIVSFNTIKIIIKNNILFIYSLLCHLNNAVMDRNFIIQ